MIVDADPQCNLTGMTLGFTGQADLDKFYTDNPAANFSAGLAPALQGTGAAIKSVQLTNTQNGRLKILAGNIDLAEAETQLSVAMTTATALPALQNLPGAPGSLLRKTAEENGVDYVLVDMSPSVGALNACLLMASDNFIVPTSPDYFCFQAIESLSRVLPRWNQQLAMFRQSSLVYALPKDPPRMLGMISQRYRPRSGNPASSFQEWIDRIKKNVDDKLVPELEKIDMVIKKSEFDSAGAQDSAYNLVNIADFNTLIAQSQSHSTPIFALTDAQINRVGVILETMQKSRDNFGEVFNGFAKTIEALVPK